MRTVKKASTAAPTGERGSGIYRLMLLSLLTAAALILFTVESRLPALVPVPGAKLGLANIITVYAVWQYKPSEALMILLTRIFLGSLFCGGLSTLILSLTGGMCCFGAMTICVRFIDEKHIWFASIVGAVFHNIGQIAAATVLTGTLAVAGYLPVLMLTGCAAGALTGMTACIVMNRIGKAGTRQF